MTTNHDNCHCVKLLILLTNRKRGQRCACQAKFIRGAISKVILATKTAFISCMKPKSWERLAGAMERFDAVTLVSWQKERSGQKVILKRSSCCQNMARALETLSHLLEEWTWTRCWFTQAYSSVKLEFFALFVKQHENQSRFLHYM